MNYSEFLNSPNRGVYEKNKAIYATFVDIDLKDEIKIKIMDKERYFLHFKGGLYKMIIIAKDSETLESMVVYQALYGEKGFWVRPEKMFFEKVVRGDVEIPRFKEITEEEMMDLFQQKEKDH